MTHEEDAWRDLLEAGQSLPKNEALLLAELKRSALAYAHARSTWLSPNASERADLEDARSRNHDRFIDSCNALSRACGRSGLSQEWRAIWGEARTGEPRRRIGDFACYITYQLALEAR
jgi:hypothetical protein